jgi:hypothetical protein
MMVDKYSIAEQKEQLDALFECEIDAAYRRCDAVRRVFRSVPMQESDGMLLEAFWGYTAGLAVETGQSKEEFLILIGEMFDNAEEVESEDKEEAPPISTPRSSTPTAEAENEAET